MKRIEMDRHGEPTVLRVVEREAPTPGPGEVRIAVYFAGVNFGETLMRRGVYPVPVELPFSPGTEIVGLIDAVGDGVNERTVGERVMALTREGGYAEAVVVNADAAIPIPSSVHMASVTALLSQGLTAAALSEVTPVEGKTVLVTAAAGGVGTLLVQYLVAAGAQVIAAVGSAPKAEIVGKLGALPVRYDTPGWADGRSFDVVFDSVGGTIYREALAHLAPFGAMVIFGAASGELVELDAAALGSLIFSNHRVIGLALPALFQLRPEWISRVLKDSLAKLERGELVVPTPTSFLLEDAADAHHALESRRTTGKVVLRTQRSIQ